MLKEARKPLNILRSLIASFLLAFAAAVFTVSTLALAFALLHFLLPTVANALADFLHATTNWIGFNIEVFPTR